MSPKICGTYADAWTRVERRQIVKAFFGFRKLAREQGYQCLSVVNRGQMLRQVESTDLEEIRTSDLVGSYFIIPHTLRKSNVFDKFTCHSMYTLDEFTELPYLFYIANGPHLVGFNSLDLAMHVARNIICKGEHIHVGHFQPIIDNAMSDTVKLCVDEEYSVAAGVVEEKPTVLPVCAMERHLPEHIEEIEPVLYEKFAESLDYLLDNPNESKDLLSRMGNTKVLSAVYHPFHSAVLYSVRDKRKLTPTQWLEASGKICVIASQFPKPASIKSNGQVRTVVCPSPSLEAWQRAFFNYTDVARFDNYIVDICNMAPYRYSYDIKSSDAVIGPYFRKYCRDRFPELEDFMMPLVFDTNSVPYRTKALPSGVVHTAIVTNAFTNALCLRLGLERYHFQGDGFVSDRPVCHPILRQNPDHELNGFKRFPDMVVRFVRTHKLKEPQYLRPGKIQGKLRYAVRYYAYEFMLAVGLNNYPKPEIKLRTAQEKLSFLSQHIEELPREAARQLRAVFHERVNCETTVFGREDIKTSYLPYSCYFRDP